jgi:hypothetical protein
MEGKPAWLPHLAGLRVDRVFLKGSTIRIEATATSPRAVCPGCGSTCARVHSRYERRLADTGIGGRSALLVLSVRRFFCEPASCPKTTFAEQVPGLTRRYGRHTGPADHVVAAAAMALGGRAVARVGGVRPSGSALVEPFEDRVVGELVEWTDTAGDDESSVARSMSSRRRVRMFFERAACTAAKTTATR